MKNKLYRITKTESGSIKKKLQQEGLWLGEMDGGSIRTQQDFLDCMSTTCGFPYATKSMDGYLDWIRDLSWLEKDGYALFIYNADEFLSQDPEFRERVFESFTEIVFPWWEYDIEHYVVDGKAKPFNVYLIA